MRIAQVAPLAESVPPKLYGGTERVVSWLTEELVALGHDVTLFATGDSRTSARLVPVWPKALRFSRPRPEAAPPCAALLETVARQVEDFDVVHCHTDWLHLPLLRRLGTPVLTTLHGRLDFAYLKHVAASFADCAFVSISNSQRLPLQALRWSGTVYHGQPPDLLKPNFEPQNYLAFLGRLSPEKGPHTAIRIAKSAHLPLRIAAKLPRSQNRFFREQLQPLIEDGDVEFIGEVDDEGKQSLLGNAAALLFPIDWPEPFGLVMIEAMACGTPVIAWRRGSVPEIVDEGLTGFVVDSLEEAVSAVGRLGELDRRKIRATFERRFSAQRMAEDYVELYRALGAPLVPEAR
jgi:glycosyltransferase involved in cell wall biosynthesis